MKKLKLYYLLSIVILNIFSEVKFLNSQTAHTNWSKLSKKIAIHPGKNISAWLDRGIVTNMIPAGDGSYLVRLDLTPGYEYNFILFAYTSNNPPAGLQPYYTYYDQVPSTGRILTSIYSNGINFQTNYAYYGPVGPTYDARRVVYVPEFGNGTNFYVFNNFSDRPKPPEKFEAVPGNGKVILNWSYPVGNWNQIDANVVAGGKYYIYTNSVSPSNSFGLLTSVEGYVTSYTHTGLINGKTYYYAIISSDAYTSGSGYPLTNMKSLSTNKSYATPNDYMPVYFKVQDIKWEVVEKNNYIVYLTPSDCDARFYFNKFIGRIAKCELKKSKNVGEH